MMTEMSRRVGRVIVAAAMLTGVAAVTRAQGLDATFAPGANAAVRALAVQPDGRILVGGQFTGLGGGSGTTSRSFIGRINVDGSLDSTFNPGANGIVYALAVQPDGKILVGGQFTTFGGGGTGTSTRQRLARLNADGSLDATFDPGANDLVYAIALQPDGKIIVVGQFTMLGGGGSGTTPRSFVGRLNSDGSLDVGFDPGADALPYTVAVQPDGRIVIGGSFTTLGGGGTGSSPRSRIGRLNGDGSIDSTFNPGANGLVQAVAVQPDGRILMGGAFTAVGGGSGSTSRRAVARLHADGSVDSSFNPGANDTVFALAIQADAKVLVGGRFTTFGGGGAGLAAHSGIARINASGSVDSSFAPSAVGTVYAVTLMGDGRAVVGGSFSVLGGTGASTTSRSNIGRLTNYTPAVDFTEDSVGDTLVVNATTGAWTALSGSAGAGFNTYGSGIWSPGWEITPASFNTDGLTDFFLFNPSSGQWFRMSNTGGGTFTAQSSAAWATNWQRFIVDLDGDGLSDVFLWDPALGEWFECLSTPGGNFTYVHGYWSPGWELYPMRFNADALQDFFLFNRNTGQWFWATGARDATFTYPQSAFWSTDWQFVPGDYSGDGVADLLLFRPNTGFWFVATTATNGFGYSSGFFTTGFTIYPIDLDGDSKMDLFLHNGASGQWFAMLSSGSGGFSVSGSGTWSLGWGIYPTDFTADGRGDLLLYNATTGVWFQARNLTGNTFSYASGSWTTGLTVVVRRSYGG